MDEKEKDKKPEQQPAEEKSGTQNPVSPMDVMDAAEPQEDEYREFPYEGTNYKTIFTHKFLARKPFQWKNPCEVITILPGTIARIMVKKGDKITPEKCLIIVEAMKMNNKVFSGIAGVVDKILVTEGQVVAKGDVLIELAPLKGRRDSKADTRVPFLG